MITRLLGDINGIRPLFFGSCRMNLGVFPSITVSHMEKWTGTSTSSILTGTHPPTHGIYGASDAVIPDDIKTVPEILSENGYHTIGISPNPNAGVAKGLDRGFEEFEYLNLSEKKNRFLKRQGLRRSRN